MGEGRDFEHAEGMARCWQGEGGSMSHRDFDMLVLILNLDGRHMENLKMDVGDGEKVVEGEGAAALE